MAILREHDLNRHDPGKKEISIKTVHLVPGQSDSDLAVIELDEPVVLDDKANIVEVSRSPLEPRDFVTTAGWGMTGRGSVGSNVLLKAELEVSRVEGILTYTKVKVVKGVAVDPCHGDSGGPLVKWRDESESWTLAATLQGGGYSCSLGATEGDGLWNSVAQHYDWIQSLLSADGCSKDSDCPSSQACSQSSCSDPCNKPRVCGQEATCRTVRHRSVCSCPPGLLGDPLKKCTRARDNCSPNPCGEGALCHSVPEGAQCSCPKGFLGDPLKKMYQN